MEMSFKNKEGVMIWEAWAQYTRWETWQAALLQRKGGAQAMDDTARASARAAVSYPHRQRLRLP